MDKSTISLITLAALMLSVPAMADQSLTISLDPSQGTTLPSAKHQLQLNHETLGATRKSSQRQYTAHMQSGSTHAKEATIGRVGVIVAAKAEIKPGPSPSKRNLYVCPKDTYLAILGQNGDWYGVLMSDSSTGWIEKSKVNLLDYQAVGKTTPQSSGLGPKIVNTALKYLGIRYRWGGYSLSGIDCSGFVKAIFASHGVQLPRVARDQASVGSQVSFKELQAGDRLYFSCKGRKIDHTGVYMGNGYFIHSSISRGGVAVDSIYKPLFINSLVVARRS